MYGPGARITQAQYDRAAAIVDEVEHEELMRLRVGSKRPYDDGKPEWLRQNNSKGKKLHMWTTLHDRSLGRCDDPGSTLQAHGVRKWSTMTRDYCFHISASGHPGSPRDDHASILLHGSIFS